MTSRHTPPPADLPAERQARPAKENRSGRRIPPWPVWGILLICAAAIGWLRQPNGLDWHGLDSAWVNILTLILGFVAFVSLFAWITFLSGFSRRIRRAVLLGIPALIAVFFVFFRIEHTWGALVPKFAPRWAPPRDELLPKPRPTQAATPIDLLTTTADDFPQFLGPQRSASRDDIKLARDWSSHPPKLLWKHAVGAGWSAYSVVNGFAVTLEQRGNEELVTCYDVKNGNLQWFHGIAGRHSTVPGGVGPRSTPTISGGKVYALGATGVLRCLDGSTGSLVWSHDLLADYGVKPGDDEKSIAWGRAASPLIVDQTVVVPAGGPRGGPHVSLVAYDKETGEKIWEGGHEQVSYSSPSLATIDGTIQIIIVNESSITGHVPATGAVLWRFEWPGTSNMDASTSQAVPIGEGQFFVSKGYNGGATIFQLQREGETWSATELWKNPRLMKTKFTNVAVKDGFVYGLSDGILECIDLAGRKRAWKQGRYGHGQLLRIGDLLLVVSETGELILVEANPREHVELGRFQALDGQTWNNPALAGGHLLVRNAEEAACYELPLDGE